MSKKLGGTLFIHNGIEFDYCFMEAIRCLQEFCDEVVVVNVGSTDGTTQQLQDLVTAGPTTKIVHLPKNVWESYHGKEKLAIFTNMALPYLTGCDYYFNLQADEIVHENSYEAIREAIQTDKEAFLARRINLWGSPFTKLVVPESRMPCSTAIIRLARLEYRSVGDGESIQAPAESDYLEKIRIFHMGFVRKRSIMKHKIMHMQENVFCMDHDPKLDKSEIFDPSLWFTGDELATLKEPLPKIIQRWALERSEK